MTYQERAILQAILGHVEFIEGQLKLGEPTTENSFQREFSEVRKLIELFEKFSPLLKE